MKNGIESATGVLEVTVTDEMTARLDDRQLHPVYSTFWACWHAETAARRAIEPFFEEGENAVGSALELRHLAMAKVGCHIRVEATVTQLNGRRIVCTIRITGGNENTLLAEGVQEQTVLAESRLQDLVSKAVM